MQYGKSQEAIDRLTAEQRRVTQEAGTKAHPVVPGSPICGMRMPWGGRLRRAREGIEWLASDRSVDSPTRAKGPQNCHRHADKQLKAPEKLGPQPRFRFHPPALDVDEPGTTG